MTRCCKNKVDKQLKINVVKIENRTSYKIIAVLALMMALWSCKDDINKTGYDLLLPGDLLSAHKMTMDKSTMESFTVRDQKLSTNKPGYNLLGSFADAEMGLTTADFAAQFVLLERPQYKLTHQIDSMVLLIGYRSFYGDTTTPLKFNVYELTADSLDDSDYAVYDQEVDLKEKTNGLVIGSTIHYATHRDSLRNEADTTSFVRDTITMNIRIKLDPAIYQRLVELSLSSLEINVKDPNIPFLKSFKGLYVESEPVTEGGAILKSFPYAIAIYSRPEATTPGDSTQVSYFEVSNNAARVNRFTHDYTSTDFFTNLNNEIEQDTLIYLQTTGGLSSKIKIPGLNNWAHPDSAGITINKAQLIFTVERTMTDTIPTVRPEDYEGPYIYTAPPKLILSLIGDKGEMFVDSGIGKGGLIYPADLNFSESYYGGFYNQKEGTYTFNLASHLQKLIRGVPVDINGTVLKNNGFYLTTDKKNSIFNRVVLKGATSTTGIRLEVTYTKIN